MIKMKSLGLLEKKNLFSGKFPLPERLIIHGFWIIKIFLSLLPGAFNQRPPTA
jgi:hypothetical protein